MLAEIPLEILVLLAAFILDYMFGDPRFLPHLIVGYGKLITTSEQTLNMGACRKLKGLVVTVALVSVSYILPYFVLSALSNNHYVLLFTLLSIVCLFYCLANRTLVYEGKKVFDVLEQKGLEAARTQLSFIVGRQTENLTEDEVKAATLETVSENLSDGVIAPLFYFIVLGVPGAMAYKMINTLDSMIGYRNERFEEFGKFAARLDDVANYIPARLTALLMLASRLQLNGIGFVWKQAVKHKSPNAGYPEAALAFLLNCRLGGPSYYHGVLMDKAYIGISTRPFTGDDIEAAARINFATANLLVFIGILLML